MRMGTWMWTPDEQAGGGGGTPDLDQLGLSQGAAGMGAQPDVTDVSGKSTNTVAGRPSEGSETAGGGPGRAGMGPTDQGGSISPGGLPL